MAFKFNAEVRTAQGKGASRRLRHNGQIPAIVYGGSEEPVSIILNHDVFISNYFSQYIRISHANVYICKHM